MLNPMIMNHITANRRHLFSAFLISVIFSPLAVSAGVYKWTDEQGNVHYGNQRPADASSERLQVKDGLEHNPYADPAYKPPKDEAKKADSDATKEEQQPEVAPPPVNEPPKISKKEKRKRCQQAKSALASIQSKGRLREIDAQGNYAYVSEKNRQKRMTLEKKDIREYCR